MTRTPCIRRALVLSGLVPVDAQVLLAHVLGRNRAWLLAHGDDALGHEHADAFFALARRRRAGEPVAYLTGTREFWGLPLEVTPAVLIPRPETETLVELALARLPAGAPARLLDLGTGSGAIALAIARERGEAEVIATDAYAPALAVARANAARLGVSNVAFRHGDWYRALASGDAPFDVIVSNPPYVAAGDPHLNEGDLPFEPAAALAGGADGLSALREVTAGAGERLIEGGTLAVEHGHDQAMRVQRLMQDAGFSEVATMHDLAGIARVTFGRRMTTAARSRAGLRDDGR